MENVGCCPQNSLYLGDRFLSTADDHEMSDRVSFSWATAMTDDLAGNTLEQALNLGTFTNRTRSIREFVGRRDPADFYKIKFARSSYTVISLTNLRNDVDVATLNSSGRQLQLLDNSGRRSELAYGFTPAGTYYLKVFPAGNKNSSYKLTVHSVVVPPALLPSNQTRSQMFMGNGLTQGAPQPGTAIRSLDQLRSRLRNDDQFSTATNLGLFGNRTSNVRDVIGGGDASDIYRIKVTSDSHAVISLVGLRGEAGFVTYNSNFQRIAVFDNPGRQNELAFGNTVPGTYYIQVFSTSNQETPYRLTVHTAALP